MDSTHMDEDSSDSFPGLQLDAAELAAVEAAEHTIAYQHRCVLL